MAQRLANVVLDQAAIAKMLGADGMVGKAVEKAAGVVRDRAKMNLTNAGRVNTGALRNDIKSKRVESSQSNEVWFEVGSDLPYASLQHEGVEGPIYPKRAKVLRFKPKGSSEYVFAASVSGFKGVPYLKDAIDSLQVGDYL